MKLSILLLCALSAVAQTPIPAPDAFLAAGAGISTGKQIQGWFAYGKLLTSATGSLPTYEVTEFQPMASGTAITESLYSRFLVNDQLGLWAAAMISAGVATTAVPSGSTSVATTLGNFTKAGGVIGWRIPKTSFSIVYQPAATFSNLPGSGPSQHLFGILWRVN